MIFHCENRSASQVVERAIAELRRTGVLALVTENRAACVSAGVNVVHGHDCD